MKKSRLSLALIACFILLFTAACDSGSGSGGDASDFPSKPIEVIVAYDAGGGTDVGARLLTNAAEKTSGETFVVVNKPGAGGELGYSDLAKAKPDGYTIGFINLPTFVTLPKQRETGYEIDGVEPIMLQVYDPAVLVVGKDEADIDTLDKFLEYAKDNPKDITIANNGTGASDHLAAADLANKAGIELNHVPFNGSSELLAALRGKHVKGAVAKISEVSQFLNSGEMIAVAAMTKDPIEGFEDIPTLTENGIEVIAGSGRGVVAPKGTPKEIIEKLAEMLKEAAELDEYQEKAENINLPLRYLGPEEFKTFIEEEDETVTNLLKDIEL